MNRFFTSDISDNKAYLSSEDAYHLHTVLRARAGDEFEICDGVEKEYIAVLDYCDKKSAVLTIKEEITQSREPKHNYYICQGIPKGRKTDDVVRHGTELGMRGFYPVISERVNVKNLSDYDKTDRSQRIVDEAAKQSKRIRIPVVYPPIKFDEIIKIPATNAVKIIAWEEETQTSLKQAVQAAPKGEDVYIIIGPEGGLSRDEVTLARENGWISVTLGKRILRTETAPLTLLSAIAYELNDLE